MHDSPGILSRGCAADRGFPHTRRDPHKGPVTFVQSQ